MHEYRAEEFRALCARAFARVELFGLFHARRLRVHALALSAGWDAVHPRCGLTEPLLRLVHALDRRARLRAAAGARALDSASTSSPSAGREPRGELALVLHTHMPYVEGFGTWPFGEEWLWEAIATCYLPLLGVLDERRAGHAVGHARCSPTSSRRCAAGAAARFLAFLRDVRAESHALDWPGLRAGGEDARRRGRARGGRLRARRRRFEALGHDLLGARCRRDAPGRRRPPTRCCRCWPPTRGVRLQVSTGIEATARASATGRGGFWLPECAHAPWLDPLLEEAGVHAACVDLTDVLGPGVARPPACRCARAAGPLLVPSTA